MQGEAFNFVWEGTFVVFVQFITVETATVEIKTSHDSTIQDSWGPWKSMAHKGPGKYYLRNLFVPDQAGH
eukprot:11226724-Lingulodinium_polyedra.AAC.1